MPGLAHPDSELYQPAQPRRGTFLQSTEPPRNDDQHRRRAKSSAAIWRASPTPSARSMSNLLLSCCPVGCSSQRICRPSVSGASPWEKWTRASIRARFAASFFSDLTTSTIKININMINRRSTELALVWMEQ